MGKTFFWVHSVIAIILVSNYANSEFFSYMNFFKIKQKLNFESLRNILEFPAEQNKNICPLCVLAVNTLLTSAKMNESEAIVKSKVMSICRMLKFDNNICSGVIDIFLPVVLEALKMTSTTPRQICNMFMEDICPNVNVSQHEWTVKLPNVAKPALKKQPPPNDDGPKLKALQLNDFHLDLHYSEGSNANCDEPLCCRTFSNTKDSGVIFPAGRWGAYKCDLPLETFEKTLEHIAAEHGPIDYIMWVGDVTPHDIWRESKSEILETIQKSVDKMKRIFPDTKIFPNIGNHDLLPAGTFTPPWVDTAKHNMSWLLSKLYVMWESWIPQSEKARFLENGFYSALIRPGFRIISLNTNYCFNLNWWLYVNSTDPGNQLKWLAEKLQEAENTGEKVHIMGHIPPGHSSCLKTWSANYYRIIDRYEDTVTAQFFAHTHTDEFQVFYDENLERPVSVGYIGPSLTPHDGYNPAYRIYYIDENPEGNSTWEVLDHETWILDLDKANSEMQKVPEWMHCYSAKDTYNLTSLRPAEWNNLIHKMKVDNDIFQTFYKHYHRNSPASKPSTEKNKGYILCRLKSGKSHSREEFCQNEN